MIGIQSYHATCVLAQGDRELIHKETRIVCIRPKGRTQCIFPRSQHSCLYVYIYIDTKFSYDNNVYFSIFCEHRQLKHGMHVIDPSTCGYKWFYVVKSGVMWFYVAKWFYVVKWFYVAKWLYVATVFVPLEARRLIEARPHF